MLETLVEGYDALVGIGFDTDDDPTTGASTLPGDQWVTSAPLGLEHLVLLPTAGDGALLSWDGTALDEVATVAVEVDRDRNVVRAVVDALQPGDETWRAVGVAGTDDDGSWFTGEAADPRPRLRPRPRTRPWRCSSPCASRCPSSASCPTRTRSRPTSSPATCRRVAPWPRSRSGPTTPRSPSGARRLQRLPVPLTGPPARGRRTGPHPVQRRLPAVRGAAPAGPRGAPADGGAPARSQPVPERQPRALQHAGPRDPRRLRRAGSGHLPERAHDGLGDRARRAGRARRHRRRHRPAEHRRRPRWSCRASRAAAWAPTALPRGGPTGGPAPSRSSAAAPPRWRTSRTCRSAPRTASPTRW